MIRSTLSSSPFYCMSLLVILRKVRLRLEKIQMDFLWGGRTLKKKPHLVSWSIVNTYKRNGGLGVRSLALLNHALLGKWSWRYVFYGNVFWKQIIEGRYGKEGEGWHPCEVRGSYEVGI